MGGSIGKEAVFELGVRVGRWEEWEGGDVGFREVRCLGGMGVS